MEGILRRAAWIMATQAVLWAAALTGCEGPGTGDEKGDGDPQGTTDVINFQGDGGAGDEGTPRGDGASSGGDATQQDAGGLVRCNSELDCPEERPYCAVSKYCFECTLDDHCPGGKCNEGYCLPGSCGAGETRCEGSNLYTCNEAGDDWVKSSCPGGRCVDGACGCDAGARVCDGLAVMECSADGKSLSEVAACSAEQHCSNGECIDCYPGQLSCDGNIVVTCSESGSWQQTTDCNAEAKNCVAGYCVSACYSDVKFASNTGCDYWAVDLDNHPKAQDSPFSLVVANLSDKTSKVSIIWKDSPTATSTQLTPEPVDVPSGALHVFDLPARNMGGGGIYWRAYRLQTTAPVVAYQFNPLDNVDVFSNDASLLIPANTYGTEYLIVTYPEMEIGIDDYTSGQSRGYVSVVASEADTAVTVRPTAPTLAGPGMTAMTAGSEHQFTLQPFEVLNIKSNLDGGDLTGTEITSDKPVGVFAGHDATVSSDLCCADHLEQQMFPVNAWGKTYFATKAYPRGNEPDYWRIVASEDETTVSFQPFVREQATLNRGEFLEFSSKQDFRVSADKPIMVAQILASSSEVPNVPPYADCTSDSDCDVANGYTCGLSTDGDMLCFPPECLSEGDTSCPRGHACVCYLDHACSCQVTGDPALILAAPVAQFRDEYAFLSPNKYQDDYVNLIAPTTASVEFDGLPVPGEVWVSIPGTGYKVVRSRVDDGVHTVVSSEPVGVIAYGFDDDVSYGYTAGLNLSDL